VTDPYDGVIGVFTAIWSRFEKVGFSELTEPEKVIFCAWQFVCEVNNGGIRQYFANPSGEFAAETVFALEEVGMPRAAGILRRAIATFADHRVPKDHDVRFRSLKAMPVAVRDEMFDALTSGFFASPEDPYALQWDYITRHSQDLPAPCHRE
jgi:uncharacterized protein DUF4375